MNYDESSSKENHLLCSLGSIHWPDSMASDLDRHHRRESKVEMLWLAENGDERDEMAMARNYLEDYLAMQVNDHWVDSYSYDY